MTELKTLYDAIGEIVEPDVWGSGGFSSGKYLHNDRGRGIQRPNRFFSQKVCDGITFAEEHEYEAKVIKPDKYNLKEREQRIAYLFSSL